MLSKKLLVTLMVVALYAVFVESIPSDTSSTENPAKKAEDADLKQGADKIKEWEDKAKNGMKTGEHMFQGMEKKGMEEGKKMQDTAKGFMGKGQAVEKKFKDSAHDIVKKVAAIEDDFLDAWF